MSNLTTHKKLVKPLSNEKYDIEVFNNNADIIDTELHKLDVKNQEQDNLLVTKEELNTHKNNRENPHEVKASQLGLGNVENKSSEQIRSEITKENVTAALGYTPYTPDDVEQRISIVESEQEVQNQRLTALEAGDSSTDNGWEVVEITLSANIPINSEPKAGELYSGNFTYSELDSENYDYIMNFSHSTISIHTSTGNAEYSSEYIAYFTTGTDGHYNGVYVLYIADVDKRLSNALTSCRITALRKRKNKGE